MKLSDLVAPKPPATLSTSAKGEWRKLAPIAWNNGRLKAQGFRQFELLCEALALETEARAAIARDGITVGAAKKAHPAIRIADSARRSAVRLLDAFGLTADRNMSAAPDGGAEALDQLDEAQVDWCYAKPKRKRRNA